MELTERQEEALETLWITTLEEGRGALSEIELESRLGQLEDAQKGNETSDQAKSSVATDLESLGLIATGPDGLRLTEAGRPFGQDVVRRHRLAERLLVDVLDAWSDVNHAKVCKFEHLLDKGLDESICTLLGHPQICPHGKPIPQGRCCTETRVLTGRVVSALSELTEGQKGTVAYVSAQKADQLRKLTAMGVLPGAPITVLQTFPAFLFEAGHTQFAVDREIAAAIYVRLGEGHGGQQAGAAPSHRSLWERLVSGKPPDKTAARR